jgi:hypothetical protein
MVRTDALITDVFRSRPFLCTIHHLINFTLAHVENVPVVPAALDKGGAIIGQRSCLRAGPSCKSADKPDASCCDRQRPRGFEHLCRTLMAHSAGFENATALVIALRPRVASHREIT